MTLHDGSTWGRKSVALALVLLSAGCTTITVTEPTVEITLYVALPDIPAPKPVDDMANRWPGSPQPPILREETTE